MATHIIAMPAIVNPDISPPVESLEVFTRIFAFRLRPGLSRKIHLQQAGFVPGRRITTVIDTLLAAKKAASSNPRLARALALLLDFAKAYDSLDRRFLATALLFLGFPASFVNLVNLLHVDTTCRFLVNGFPSDTLKITCGIRQGCPLAPLLFILALELLYKKLECESALQGISLNSLDTTQIIKVAGYADDTTIYVHDPSEIPTVLSILTEFATVSGLQINLKKSVAVPLATAATLSSSDVCGMDLLEADANTRYLGILVGQRDATSANWSKVLSSLHARLYLARIKTNSVAQRAQLARAIIIPKILYVARHSWPPPATADALQVLVQNFVWGTRNGTKNRAWMSEEHTELGMSEGGLGIPNVRSELQLLALTTTASWASNSTRYIRLLGDILLAGSDAAPFLSHRLATRTSRPSARVTYGTSPPSGTPAPSCFEEPTPTTSTQLPRRR